MSTYRLVKRGNELVEVSSNLKGRESANVQAYSDSMAVFLRLLADKSYDDQQIINDPNRQFAGAPMPKSVCRRELDGYALLRTIDLLEKKAPMDIPTIEGCGEEAKYMEVINPKDLKMGNVLCAGALSRYLGDLNGYDGEGSAYVPNYYAFEVIGFERYGRPIVREVEGKFLRYIDGRGVIANNLIARGLPLNFMEENNGSGTPSTAAIQQFFVFESRVGFDQARSNSKLNMQIEGK
ncbi:hypothetical protein KJ632_03670 [Patescibacteria group bacterium]|nr:hypothetical protein [Patescibacteria group bacterium]